MGLQLLFLLCMAAVVIADDPEVVTHPGELDLQFTDINGTIQHYPSNRDDQLYHLIAIDKLDHALAIAQEFINNGQSYVIKNVVNQLIRHQRVGAAGFAYKLFAAGHRKIVENQFPAQFKMVFSDSVLTFVNNKYRLNIEMGSWVDIDNDAIVYGSDLYSPIHRDLWKLEPVIDGGDVYFKIRNLNDKYLKLGNSMDGDGDYQAYASPSADTHRHQWMFQPVEYEGKLCFCIVNRGHPHALKYAVNAFDDYRHIYASSGDFYNYPERFGWTVNVKSDA